MRVVVLDHTADLGGAELALLRLCGAIDGSEFDVRVVLFSDGILRHRLEAAGVPVVIEPVDPDVSGLDRFAAGRFSWSNVKRAVRTVPFVWRLARRVRDLDPDVIQSNTLKSSLIGLVVAALARRPLVWYLHDRISGDYLPAALVRIVRVAARLPRVVLANSQAAAMTVAPRRCVLAHPGYAPEQALGRFEDRAAPSEVAVGLVGRISPTKGQLEFVRAAQRVLEKHPKVRFRVIGSPMFGAEEYADRVNAEVRTAGIENAVEFTGFVDDPLAEVDRLTVVVHASPVPEPFGQVIVEAMIRGVPVIATRAGGVIEIVCPQMDPDDPGASPLGLMVEPGDVDALASAIDDVIGDPLAARARAEAAYASACVRFSATTTAAVVTDVWRSLAPRPRPVRQRGVVDAREPRSYARFLPRTSGGCRFRTDDAARRAGYAEPNDCVP